jgi:hypothetical protein
MPIPLSNDGRLKGCKPDSHRDAREVLPSDGPQHGLNHHERIPNA